MNKLYLTSKRCPTLTVNIRLMDKFEDNNEWSSDEIPSDCGAVLRMFQSYLNVIIS